MQMQQNIPCYSTSVPPTSASKTTSLSTYTTEGTNMRKIMTLGTRRHEAQLSDTVSSDDAPVSLGVVPLGPAAIAAALWFRSKVSPLVRKSFLPRLRHSAFLFSASFKEASGMACGFLSSGNRKAAALRLSFSGSATEWPGACDALDHVSGLSQLLPVSAPLVSH